MNISWSQICEDPFSEVLEAIIEHYPLPSVHSLFLVTCKGALSDEKDLPPNLAAFMAHLPSLASLKITAPARHHPPLIGKMTFHHFPRLKYIVIITSPTTISSWLPSLKKNCANLAGFVVTFEPFVSQKPSMPPGMLVACAERLREELEQASSVYQGISIQGYANIAGQAHTSKLVQIWPVVPLSEGDSRLGTDDLRVGTVSLSTKYVNT